MKNTEALELADGGVSEASVLDAYNAACSARERHVEARAEYALRALGAGFRFLEYRDFVGKSSFNGRVCHSGKPSVNGRNQHSDGDGFLKWLEEKDISQRTAYRWMAGARAVGLLVLGMTTSEDLPLGLGSGVSFSAALLEMQNKDSEAGEFYQKVVEFIGNQTLAAAVRAALDGDSEASRITRAANGLSEGGGPDVAHDANARKDFPAFALRAMANCLSHIGAAVDKKGGHWSALKPAEKQTVLEGFKHFVSGLPDEVVEYLEDQTERERRARDGGEQPKPLALKAVVNKQIADKGAGRGRAKANGQLAIGDGGSLFRCTLCGRENFSKQSPHKAPPMGHDAPTCAGRFEAM